MTQNCVSLTQSSVILITHRNVCLKCFLHLPKFLLSSLVFAYIYISQGTVEMHFQCSEIYNNHIIANCLQSAPVKKNLKIGQQLAKIRTKVKCHVFHGAQCMYTL